MVVAPTPALAKQTSRPPKVSTAVCTIVSTSLSAPASACMASASPPASLICAAVSSTLGARSTATTRAPSAANSLALARPMPLPAPVTSATLPSSRPMLRPRSLLRGDLEGRGLLPQATQALAAQECGGRSHPGGDGDGHGGQRPHLRGGVEALLTHALVVGALAQVLAGLVQIVGAGTLAPVGIALQQRRGPRHDRLGDRRRHLRQR